MATTRLGVLMGTSAISMTHLVCVRTNIIEAVNEHVSDIR